MEVRYSSHPADVKKYDTEELRKHFHTKDAIGIDEFKFVYTHYDRYIYGGISPVNGEAILPNYDELKAEFFLERREMGVINTGGSGTITVDGEAFHLRNLDMLYIGKGAKNVSFKSDDSGNPSKYYINSTPAHQHYPTTLGKKEEANVVDLGSSETSNHRVIYQFIHENGIQSCQLVMGYTELMPGSVWNTFPPHTHDRRMEIYFYFDMPEDQIVVHFMGQGNETRHIMMHNGDAVISPPWSIHSGAGTASYKFVWGMGGENQAFTDMDGIPLTSLR